MSAKRGVLEKLKRDELLAAVSRFELAVGDRRVREDLISALAASRKAGLKDILEDLPRARLKEICREIGLDDSGREKAVLIARLTGRDSSPSDSQDGGAASRSEEALAPDEHQERAAKRSPRAPSAKPKTNAKDKSLESWIWDAACSIRGAQEAPKFKDFILPLIFTKRLCDVFDDELNRIAVEVGSRAKAFKLVEMDHKLVRFYLPLKPQDPEDAVWSVIRTLTGKIGESLTTYLHEIAKANPKLEGIIDRMDFNATTHGQRDIDDDRLSNLIEKISEKHLGLKDVEADIIGRSYEYLIRKFAEGSGQSAGEFFTPPEVARIMARIMDPEPGMSVYDPCCGSAGLLIACEHVLDEKMKLRSRPKYAPLKMHGQEYIATTWAMASMNMIIHDMEGTIEIGDTFKYPKFRGGNRLQTFDRVVSNPMWNQNWFKEEDYDADELGRFRQGTGFPGAQSADWGWAQHMLASLNSNGRAAIVLDTGAASRGSGNANKNKEQAVRQWFVEQDLIEGVIYLPENLFYNTSAPGILLFLNRDKPKDRQDKLFLVNASQVVEKGDPKNFIPPGGIERIATAFNAWKEEEKFAKVVTREQAAKEDYNVSPSRYIHVADVETHRPIAEILKELEALEDEAAEANSALRAALQKAGI
ncbi:MAG TPA: N-6 DNA methylase [Thermoanaerobaculia bacterium]|jgi:type I restriction enzyme M protein|nr:N-6 DNA methylase [Thermoanaerobaculia bacterium]